MTPPAAHSANWPGEGSAPIAPSSAQRSLQPAGLTPPPNFNRLAHLYRWMEIFTFGPWLQRCRCAWLGRFAQSRRALVLGDGDGRFTAQLLRANPIVCVDAVDASESMLEALLQRAHPHSERVTAHRADIRRFTPSHGDRGPAYDLIVTHFFLDCLTEDEVQSLAVRVRHAAADGALWAVSEFAVPANRFGRFIARPIVGALYLAFGWLTGLRVRRLPHYAQALSRAGFALSARRSSLAGLLVAELWQATPQGEP